MCISAPKLSKRIMKNRIKKETKTTLPTYGKYKAVAVHYQTVESSQIVKETITNQAIATWTVTLLWM